LDVPLTQTVQVGTNTHGTTSDVGQGKSVLTSDKNKSTRPASIENLLGKLWISKNLMICKEFSDQIV